MLPNAELYYRRGLDLKKIIPQAKEKDFTDIMVINETLKNRHKNKLNKI
jgi:ribosome production factor 1